MPSPSNLSLLSCRSVLLGLNQGPNQSSDGLKSGLLLLEETNQSAISVNQISQLPEALNQWFGGTECPALTVICNISMWMGSSPSLLIYDTHACIFKKKNAARIWFLTIIYHNTKFKTIFSPFCTQPQLQQVIPMIVQLIRCDPLLQHWVHGVLQCPDFEL